MSNVFVRPALVPSPDDPARLVRAHVVDPATGAPLAHGGEHKPLSAFWARRLSQGDVEECAPADQADQADQAATSSASSSSDAAEKPASVARRDRA